jgi:hypothetical protein
MSNALVEIQAPILTCETGQAVVRDNLVLPSKISEMNGSINQAIVIA